MKRTIKITKPDMDKLSSLLESWRSHLDADREHLQALEEELDRAEVLTTRKPPSGLVVMNSWVTVTDMNTGQRYEYQLVFPRHADLSQGKISVLAPIGTALLGYRVGSEIEWKVPGGLRRLRVDDVMHEASASTSRGCAA